MRGSRAAAAKSLADSLSYNVEIEVVHAGENDKPAPGVFVSEQSRKDLGV